jgi:hypothetical protein
MCKLLTTDLNVPITYFFHLSHHIDLLVKVTLIALVLRNIRKWLIYFDIFMSYLLSIHNQTLLQLIHSYFRRSKARLFRRFQIKFNTGSHQFSSYLVSPTEHAAFMAWLYSSISCLLSKIIDFLGITQPPLCYLSWVFKRVVLWYN